MFGKLIDKNANNKIKHKEQEEKSKQIDQEQNRISIIIVSAENEEKNYIKQERK